MVRVETANQLADLRKLLEGGGDKSLAVAYVSDSGLTLIRESLKRVLAGKSRRVRFLLGLDDSGVTDPHAVKRLLELSSTYANLEVKAFIPASGNEIFHPKLFISHARNGITFLTGSFNLTEAALRRNKEHGLKVTCDGSEDIGKQTLQVFNSLWEDVQARLLTDDVANGYQAYCKDGTQTQPDGEAWEAFKKGIPPNYGPLPTWPSPELAFLMGAINARGTFDRKIDRIKVKLDFGTQGSFQVRGEQHPKKDQSHQVRQRILEEVLNCLPGSKEYGSVSGAEYRTGREPIKVSPSRDQVLFVEFPAGKTMFEVLSQAYDSDTARIPPKYLTSSRANREIVKRFLQGYALASGTIDDKHESEVRLHVLPKADGGPIKRLIDNKTKARAEIKHFKGNEYIAVPMADFRKAIGFNDSWMSSLAANYQDRRPRSRRPTPSPSV